MHIAVHVEQHADNATLSRFAEQSWKTAVKASEHRSMIWIVI